MDYSKYLDADGYPGTRQADGSYDGGDTAAIIGTIEALEGPWLAIPTLPWHEKAQVPIRHPDEAKWYSQPDRFSRDQLIPNICAAIRYDYILSPYLYAAHKRRWFLTAWNSKGNGGFDKPKKFPDICGPSVWALWLRYRKPVWSRLVLGLLDLETLISAINWRWFIKPTNRVSRNLMLKVIFSRKYQPTLVSRLAYAITDFDDLIARWDAHCAAVGEYPTADLFREALK